jgi:lipopolysaccharide transport system permease protein
VVVLAPTAPIASTAPTAAFDSSAGAAPQAGVAPAADLPLRLIAPSRGWISLRLGEVWRYRELLLFLMWRDIALRYKQTALGVAWAVIQPVMTMVVFSLFFGRLAGMPSDGVPYPIFSYAALLPWTYFAGALGQSSNSLVGSANLISKVYFPRLIIPCASVLTGLVDFAIAFVILLAMMVYYGVRPTAATVALPLFLLLACATALGVGLWLSALSVRYRDIRYVVPFLTQVWLFATPVAYPSSLLSGQWRVVYAAVNPMVGVVEGFRWALLGSNPPGPMLAASAGMAAVVLVTGAFYFRRMERTFADIV